MAFSIANSSSACTHDVGQQGQSQEEGRRFDLDVDFTGLLDCLLFDEGDHALELVGDLLIAQPVRIGHVWCAPRAGERALWSGRSRVRCPRRDSQRPVDRSTTAQRHGLAFSRPAWGVCPSSCGHQCRCCHPQLRCEATPAIPDRRRGIRRAPHRRS